MSRRILLSPCGRLLPFERPAITAGLSENIMILQSRFIEFFEISCKPPSWTAIASKNAWLILVPFALYWILQLCELRTSYLSLFSQTHVGRDYSHCNIGDTQHRIIGARPHRVVLAHRLWDRHPQKLMKPVQWLSLVFLSDSECVLSKQSWIVPGMVRWGCLTVSKGYMAKS